MNALDRLHYISGYIVGLASAGVIKPCPATDGIFDMLDRMKNEIGRLARDSCDLDLMKPPHKIGDIYSPNSNDWRASDELRTWRNALNARFFPDPPAEAILTDAAIAAAMPKGE